MNTSVNQAGQSRASTGKAIKARYYRKGNGISERRNRTVQEHPVPFTGDGFDPALFDNTIAICLSPDGSKAQAEMVRRIVAALNYTESIPLEELERANQPFFNPITAWRITEQDTAMEGRAN